MKILHYKHRDICLFCSIIILLSLKRDGCAVGWTNPHHLEGLSIFELFVFFTFYYLICCLFKD